MKNALDPLGCRRPFTVALFCAGVFVLAVAVVGLIWLTGLKTFGGV